MSTLKRVGYWTEGMLDSTTVKLGSVHTFRAVFLLLDLAFQQDSVLPHGLGLVARLGKLGLRLGCRLHSLLVFGVHVRVGCDDVIQGPLGDYPTALHLDDLKVVNQEINWTIQDKISGEKNTKQCESYLMYPRNTSDQKKD